MNSFIIDSHAVIGVEKPGARRPPGSIISWKHCWNAAPRQALIAAALWRPRLFSLTVRGNLPKFVKYRPSEARCDGDINSIHGLDREPT